MKTHLINEIESGWISLTCEVINEMDEYENYLLPFEVFIFDALNHD